MNKLIIAGITLLILSVAITDPMLAAIGVGCIICGGA